MLDKLREAFPQIDWSEGYDSQVKVSFVDGALSKHFRITINGPGTPRPAGRGQRSGYSAHLQLGPRGWSLQDRRSVISSGLQTSDPVQAVHQLQKRIVLLEAAFGFFRDKFPPEENP